MVFSINTVTFASSSEQLGSNSVVIEENGIYINGNYYTQDEFELLLATAQKIDRPTDRMAGALVAGTWFIPGIGEIVITTAGVITVAGVVAKAGSWIYNTVHKWFQKRAFDKSAEEAINGCDDNRKHHIMNPKHRWTKLNKNPNWKNISPILIKVLQDGDEKFEKNVETGVQYIRTLVYKGETVVVRFIKGANGLIKHIGTAWCE